MDPGTKRLPEGLDTQYFRFLVPNSIQGMVLATTRIGCLDPLGLKLRQASGGQRAVKRTSTDVPPKLPAVDCQAETMHGT